MSVYESTRISNPDGIVDDVLHLYMEEDDDVYYLGDFVVRPGKYTFSVWVRADTDCSIDFRILGNEKTNGITTQWQKILWTVDVTDADENYIYVEPDAGMHVYLYEAKLQEGNYDTRWSPAEEDVAERFRTQQARIEANENSIALKVSTKEYESYKTTVDGEISSAKSRLSSAESSITALNGKIALKVEQTDIDSALATVDSKLASYSTIAQMNSAIELAKNSIEASVSETYAKKTELSSANGKITELETWRAEASQKITKDGIIATVGNYYAYESDLQTAENRLDAVETKATQNADKFQWIVKSGTSSTDFTLTDRTATLIAQTISLNGNVKVNGNMLVDGAVTAKKLSVTSLSAISSNIGTVTTGKIMSDNFSQSDSPFADEGMYISFSDGYIVTKGLVIYQNGNAKYKGSLEGADGTFLGKVESKNSYDDRIILDGSSMEFYCNGKYFGSMYPVQDETIIDPSDSTRHYSYMYMSCDLQTGSDETRKNILPWKESYDDLLMEIEPISYTWKDRNDPKSHVGIGARKTWSLMEKYGMEKHALVNRSADGMYSVGYQELHGLEIASIQKNRKILTEHGERLDVAERRILHISSIEDQLQSQIVQLRDRVEHQESEIQYLKTRLQQLQASA